MRRLLVALLLAFSITSYSQSSGDPVNIGFFDFITMDEDEDIREGKSLTGIMKELLTNNPAIKVLPRDINQTIREERELQKLEDFILSESVAEQGMAEGAKYLLAGSLESFVIRSKSQEIGGFEKDVYEASISFSLVLVDVAKGTALEAKNFAYNTTKAGLFDFYINESQAINDINRQAKKKMANWFATLLPFDFKILKVVEADRKDRPVSVIISGGTNLDLERGEKLDVVEIGEIEGFKVKNTLAELTVDEVMGEVTKCSVSSGKKELGPKLKDESANIVIAFQEL